MAVVILASVVVMALGGGDGCGAVSRKECLLFSRRLKKNAQIFQPCITSTFVQLRSSRFFFFFVV